MNKNFNEKCEHYHRQTLPQRCLTEICVQALNKLAESNNDRHWCKIIILKTFLSLTFVSGCVGSLCLAVWSTQYDWRLCRIVNGRHLWEQFYNFTYKFKSSSHLNHITVVITLSLKKTLVTSTNSSFSSLTK